MTADEAHAMWAKCIAMMEQIAAAFPCDKCEGTGDLEPGGCYTPCDECWGHGFVFPEEDE